MKTKTIVVSFSCFMVVGTLAEGYHFYKQSDETALCSHSQKQESRTIGAGCNESSQTHAQIRRS